MDQQSADWHFWRQKGLGSSDASVVLGIDPYRTREELFLDKTGRGKPRVQNEAMKLGLKFEEAARAILFFEHGIEFTPHVCTHPDFPFIKASLDGYNEDEELILELKYIGRKNFDKIKESKDPLEHHYPQLQHQMLAKGTNKVLYVPYVLDQSRKKIEELQVVEIIRNDAFIKAQLFPQLKIFWDEVEEWIANNQQPKP